ncbi:hypothetical protein [Microbacterium sp. PAMC22086]|uniref:hypothetical protein n=1 Tax=Microbacterium sp. PAMC22086 TaxID=2861281 RepID=UPI001C62D763|nr:hypothetical protein [Microbacterium sp. PAMC22086]QYG10870.1 hypothetical protein KY497_11225 [Microbacterium sp. PAMC22086]
MRDGWREVSLGDVAARRADFTPVVADHLYRVVGVQRSGWGLVDREPARGDSMKFGKLMQLHVGDLVYRTITAFEAPSTVVSPAYAGAFVTPQAFPVYSIDRTQLLPGFMKLLTTSPTFHEEMAARCVGTVLRRKTLSKGAFESIPIALPSLAKQRRIVDLMASADDAIDAADAEAEATATSLSSAMAEIVRFGAGSSQPLVDLFETTLGGAWGLPAGADEQDVTALGPSAYKGGEVAVDPAVGATRSLSIKRAAARALRVGDIVLERSGGSPTQPVGRVIRMEEEHPWVVPSDFMRLLRVDRTRADPGFVFWCLWSAYRSGLARPFQKRTTSIFNLNITEYLASVRVGVPDIESQRDIAALGDAGWAAVVAVRATADALRTLRSNLLSVLLSGKHEIPSSYDHLLDLDVEAAT